MTNPYITELLSELGMSEDDISNLLNKDSIERTNCLISLFYARQDDSERLKVIFALGDIGDVKLTGDFYADVLQAENGWVKFYAALQGQMQKFNEHTRLQEAMESHLKGLSPVGALRRDFFSAR